PSHYLTSFLFTAPAPTTIYTLSLHDALPIFQLRRVHWWAEIVESSRGIHGINGTTRNGIDGSATELKDFARSEPNPARSVHPFRDRKSTRLNSSHLGISYAVFCLKKKKKKKQ